MSDKIRRLMSAEKISFAQLQQMIRNAALYSKDGWNRRYYDWLMRIDNGIVVDMMLDKMVEVGRGEVAQIEDCSSCEGAGCKKCGWRGEVRRRVTDSTAQKLGKDRVLSV